MGMTTESGHPSDRAAPRTEYERLLEEAEWEARNAKPDEKAVLVAHMAEAQRIADEKPPYDLKTPPDPTQARGGEEDHAKVYHKVFTEYVAGVAQGAKDKMHAIAAAPENPKKAHGDLKPSMHFVPMKPMLGVAKVMELGARKYGRKNWRVQPIEASTYHSAATRHLLDWWEGEDLDPESRQSHLAHAIACMLIMLDAQKFGTLRDDRNLAEAIHRLPSATQE